MIVKVSEFETLGDLSNLLSRYNISEVNQIGA